MIAGVPCTAATGNGATPTGAIRVAAAAQHARRTNPAVLVAPSTTALGAAATVQVAPGAAALGTVAPAVAAPGAAAVGMAAAVVATTVAATEQAPPVLAPEAADRQQRVGVRFPPTGLRLYSWGNGECVWAVGNAVRLGRSGRAVAKLTGRQQGGKLQFLKPLPFHRERSSSPFSLMCGL